MTAAGSLDAGLAELAMPTEPSQRDRLLAYVALLEKWNRAFNLTSVRTPEQMVVRHLLDSLSIAPWTGPASPVLDVGTGAGLPGIPLAIVRPEQSFVLLDSNGKKTRFVRQAVRELGLANVEVVQARAAQYGKTAPQVVARALAPLPALVEETAALVAPEGSLLAMKGALTDDELAAVPSGWHARVEPLRVPQLDEPRRLVVLTRTEQGDSL